MTNKSTFDFLKEDDQFYNIYINCLAMELTMNNNYHNPSIGTARVISEELLKTIIRNESPLLREQLFSKDTKDDKTFCELINIVFDEHLIRSAIKDKYHNMRQMGNPVIHPDLFEPVQYTLNDSKRVHKSIFSLAFDCFKRYNKEKIKGIIYIPISSSESETPKFDIDYLLRDIDLTQFSEYIVNYCKENILLDLLMGTITEKEVITRFKYYVARKNIEARNLKEHSELFYDPVEPKIEHFLTKEEKLKVYEKVQSVIYDGFTGSVYDLLVEEMTKIVENNQSKAKIEFEKYSNRLSDLTDLSGDEIDEYINLILSFIKNNEIKAEHITEMFIIKTGNEYHSNGRISKYLIYVAKYVEELLKDIDLSKYDKKLVEKCKNNILKDFFDKKIIEKDVKPRFKYCLSNRERERQNLLEFMKLYHNPSEPSEEILLTQEEKDAVYKKVENIIRDDYSGSVRELIIKEINLVLEDNKNKTKNKFKKYIASFSNLSELTGLVGTEVDDYINQMLLFIENYDLKAENITGSFIFNTAKEYHLKGSINKRRMLYHILNDEPIDGIIDFADDLDSFDESDIDEDVSGDADDVPFDVDSEDDVSDDDLVDESDVSEDDVSEDDVSDDDLVDESDVSEDDVSDDDLVDESDVSEDDVSDDDDVDVDSDDDVSDDDVSDDDLVDESDVSEDDVSDDDLVDESDVSGDDVSDDDLEDEGEIVEEEPDEEPIDVESIINQIPLFKKENRAGLLSITGLNEEEAEEYIDEIISLIGEGLSIERITEKFIRKTGSDYHIFGIIDI